MKYLMIFSFFLMTASWSSNTSNFYAETVSCGSYVPYYKFKNIIKEPRFHCYGEPMENFREEYCSISSCREKYIQQKFCKKGKYTTTFYHSDTNCRYSTTNYHSNKSVGITEPCGCEGDGIEVGKDWN